VEEVRDREGRAREVTLKRLERLPMNRGN
jgi:hypothetical protein